MYINRDTPFPCEVTSSADFRVDRENVDWLRLLSVSPHPVRCVSKPEDPQDERGSGKDVRPGAVSFGSHDAVARGGADKSGSDRGAADRAAADGRTAGDGMSDGSDFRRIPADRLLEAIEGELIPRLMMVHAAGATVDSVSPANESGFRLRSVPPVSVQSPERPGDWQNEDIVRFAEWASLSDVGNMIEFVESAFERGVSLTDVYLNLVAPTARLLGDNWLSDRASFIDVHMGLLELHRLVSHFELTDFDMTESSGHNILLSATPGDQHTFGILLVADFFRRAGWEVDNDSGHTEDQIARKVASASFSCIGLSLYNEEHLHDMTRCIARLRDSSLNEDVLIVVGGEYFAGKASPSAIVGADLCVLDAGTAVAEISAHLEGRPLQTSRRSGRGVTSD